MGVLVRSGSKVANTGSSTLDLDISDFNIGVKLALITVCGISDGSNDLDLRLSRGMYDGSAQWAGAIGNEDGESLATDCYRALYNDRCVVILNMTGGIRDYAIASRIDRGIRLTWNGGSAPTFAWRIRYTFWGGSDVTAETFTHTATAAQDTNDTISLSMAEEPELMTFCSVGEGVSANTVTADHQMSWGWCHSTGGGSPTITRFCNGTMVDDADPGFKIAGCHFNTRALRFAEANGTGPWTNIDVTDTNAGEIVIQKKDGGTNLLLAGAALTFHGKVKIDVRQKELVVSSAGGKSYTDPGFRPQWVEIGASNLQSTNNNSNQTGNLAMGHSMGFVSVGDLGGGSQGIFFNNGGDAGGTDTGVYFTSSAFIHVKLHNGNNSWACDSLTFTANGFDYTPSIVPTQDKWVGIVCIEEEKRTVSVAA